MSSGASNGGRGGEGDISDLEPRRLDPVAEDSDDDEEEEELLVADDDGFDEGEDDEGEDLIEGAEADYAARPRLDRYESEGLGDEDELGDASDEHAGRLRAEAALDAREQRDGRAQGTGRGRHLPGIIADDESDERPRRRRRMDAADRAAEGDDDDDDAEMTWAEELQRGATVPLANFRGDPRTLLENQAFVHAVRNAFKRFLVSFTDSGKLVYKEKIEEMCTLNKQSLEVAYHHLSNEEASLAIWVADCPTHMLPLFNEVAREVTLMLFESYDQIHHSIFVRITHLPVVDRIRDIRKIHLNVLVRMGGVVTRRTAVFPQLAQVKYDCAKCSYKLGPYIQTSDTEVRVTSCPNCQSKGPFSVNIEETIYRNYQKLTLQESPGTVPAGRLPRSKEVIVTDDLIDIARPGDEIEVTGTYTNNFDAALNMKNGFPVFATVVEANYISKKADAFAAYKLTDEDKEEIRRLSQDPKIGEKIVASIAPSIHGHVGIKTGLALSMFGGEEKHVKGKHHRLRGDINVLLLGDPGVAKSQFLKYVEKTGQRTVYTTGKGASAVGLTAAVHKDPITREWTLEGGALVLADKGICLIDEFDKMNDQDRVSIHEAMEQQSISISKAGIVTTLQARCAVIAAANPVGGRYDSSRTFAENVELTEPILSRFDILCVVKDVVDPVLDERLATFVVDSHFKSHPTEKANHGPSVPIETEISQEMLRKYITYSKQFCRPKLKHADADKISRVYADLRREFVTGQGVPIAVRHVESLIRMSEASARMHLREYVNDADVNLAIRTCLESFVSTQKYAVQRTLQRKFKGYLTYQKDFNALALDVLRSHVREALHYNRMVGSSGFDEGVRVKTRHFEEKAREYNIADLEPFYTSHHFTANGFTKDDASGFIVFQRAAEQETQ